MSVNQFSLLNVENQCAELVATPHLLLGRADCCRWRTFEDRTRRYFPAGMLRCRWHEPSGRVWHVQKMAVFARLRPRVVKRILAGGSAAGTVELYRLVRVLQLSYDATVRAAYIDAQVAQLAADTDASEQQRRLDGGSR